jgi:hypothetical protein
VTTVSSTYPQFIALHLPFNVGPSPPSKAVPMSIQAVNKHANRRFVNRLCPMKYEQKPFSIRMGRITENMHPHFAVAQRPLLSYLVPVTSPH